MQTAGENWQFPAITAVTIAAARVRFWHKADIRPQAEQAQIRAIIASTRSDIVV
jgi:hypothetical protein